MEEPGEAHRERQDHQHHSDPPEQGWIVLPAMTRRITHQPTSSPARQMHISDILTELL
jgi:hypothetical protein